MEEERAVDEAVQMLDTTWAKHGTPELSLEGKQLMVVFEVGFSKIDLQNLEIKDWRIYLEDYQKWSFLLQGARNVWRQRFFWKFALSPFSQFS